MDEPAGPVEVLPGQGHQGVGRYWWGRLNDDLQLQTLVGGGFTLIDIGCGFLHAPVPVIIVLAVPGAWILRCRMYKDRLW